MQQKKKAICCATLLLLGLSSCDKESPIDKQYSTNVTETTQLTERNKREVRNEFAVALSKALEKRPELASLLRSEAMKEFDNNTDVLYHLVKDATLSDGSKIGDLIAQEWSSEEISWQVLDRMPLLNIFASDLGLFSEELALENWDLSQEVAVAVANKEGQKILYVAGDSVAVVSTNEKSINKRRL